MYLFRSNEEKLDEKDVAVEDDTDNTATLASHHNVAVSHVPTDAEVDLGASSSQGQMKDVTAMEEEVEDDEVVIEDFDV